SFSFERETSLTLESSDEYVQYPQFYNVSYAIAYQKEEKVLIKIVNKFEKEIIETLRICLCILATVQFASIVSLEKIILNKFKLEERSQKILKSRAC
ncbi:hypothetical protein CU098_012836, partial [Rhizopus stolonifer]